MTEIFEKVCANTDMGIPSLTNTDQLNSARTGSKKPQNDRLVYGYQCSVPINHLWNTATTNLEGWCYSNVIFKNSIAWRHMEDVLVALFYVRQLHIGYEYKLKTICDRSTRALMLFRRHHQRRICTKEHGGYDSSNVVPMSSIGANVPSLNFEDSMDCSHFFRAIQQCFNISQVSYQILRYLIHDILYNIHPILPIFPILPIRYAQCNVDK